MRNSRVTRSVEGDSLHRLVRCFYVDSWSGWFVVRCRTKREAKREGVYEFGRGAVKEIRIATPDDIASYIANKGERAMEPSI